MYSQFCKLYSDYVDQHRLTMHLQHKPGDKCMVDWAGTTLSFYDSATDEPYTCYLFVATLPFSMYCYAETCLTMKQEDWINAHVHMYEYFGGVTRILVSDNLKTGVISNKKNDDPVMNRCYQELADYYKTALLPARVLSPKDKAAVEGEVGKLTSHIIAKLKNRRCFSLTELNAEVRKLLDAYNRRDFQKKDGSRYSVFSNEEILFMQTLPGIPRMPVLLKLADKYSTERLENACKVALKHIPIPRYRNIRLIIEVGQDLKESEKKTKTPFSKDPVNRYTHLRGASYYGGANHE